MYALLFRNISNYINDIEILSIKISVELNKNTRHNILEDKNPILPVLWKFTSHLKKELKLMVFKNYVLRKISGFETEDIKGADRIFHDHESRNF
jgi:hypothetical protein